MTANNRRVECNQNMVFVGIRRNGTLGYFESADLPEGWTLTEGRERDIADIMESLQATKAEALRTMNAHWQR